MTTPASKKRNKVIFHYNDHSEYRLTKVIGCRVNMDLGYYQVTYFKDERTIIERADTKNILFMEHYDEDGTAHIYNFTNSALGFFLKGRSYRRAMNIQLDDGTNLLEFLKNQVAVDPNRMIKEVMDLQETAKEVDALDKTIKDLALEASRSTAQHVAFNSKPFVADIETNNLREPVKPDMGDIKPTPKW